MTIMALVVTVLYQAFATATRVWSRQQLFDETAARQQAAARLLRDDLAQLVPYNWNDGRGKHTFFVAGERVLFYVTRNGFGCQQRGRGQLFFTCCYIAASDDGTDALMLYKVAQPRVELCRAVSDCAVVAGADWQVPHQLRDDSVVILAGLNAGSFSCATRRYLDVDTFTQPFDGGFFTGDSGLEKVRFIQFNYTLAGIDHAVCVACYHVPECANSGDSRRDNMLRRPSFYRGK